MKFIMKCGFMVAALAASFVGNAQLKSFKLKSNGDTINRVDQNDLKQGPWIMKVEPLRGQPGYEDRGVYVDNKKQGKWTRFSLMGDPLGFENYKGNLKDGQQMYYTLQGLQREENWHAFLPGQGTDSVEVQDVNDENKSIWVKVDNDGRSVKDGDFKYYNPQSGTVVKTEKWTLGKQVVADQKESMTQYKISQKEPGDTTKKVKPAIVNQYEKKNSGRKRVNTRDGQTGN